MKIGRKGAVNFLVLAVLGAAFLVVLLFALNRGNLFAQESVPKELCHQSVEANARLKLGGLDFAEAVKCPTRNIRVSDKSDEAIKRKTAELMAECWYQYGEGKGELFDTRAFGAGSDVFCAVCHTIKYEEKKTVNGFLQFLVDEHPLGKPVSYYEYLTPFQTSDDILKQLEAQREMDVINTNYNYATVFVYGKNKNFWDKPGTTAVLGGAGLIIGAVVSGFFTGGTTWVLAGAVALGTAGAAVGVKVGEDQPTEWHSGVLLVPYTANDLEKLGCQILPVKQS